LTARSQQTYHPPAVQGCPRCGSSQSLHLVIESATRSTGTCRSCGTQWIETVDAAERVVTLLEGQEALSGPPATPPRSPA